MAFASILVDKNSYSKFPSSTSPHQHPRASPMFLDALHKEAPIGPSLGIKQGKVIQKNPQPVRNLNSRIDERVVAITAELAGPAKPRVQISKSVAYPPDAKPEVKLLKSQFLGVWYYPDHTDTCAICRMHLATLCVHCENHHEETHACIVEWGECKHAYHGHCIERWMEHRSACPICQKPWIPLEQESPLG